MKEFTRNESFVPIPPVEDLDEEGQLNRGLIEEASSFDDLYETLRQIGGVEGTGKFYPAQKLIECIDGVRSGLISIGYVTRTHGLRDKVEQLLLKDK